MGTTAGLRCPAASTARIPKITLSFDTGSVTDHVPASCFAPALSARIDRCQSGASVARQTISYFMFGLAAGASAQAIVVLLMELSKTGPAGGYFTFAGSGGALASTAMVAAFSRATRAT